MRLAGPRHNEGYRTASVRDAHQDVLEMFTEGLYTDRSLLEEYLLYVPDPPRGGSQD